MIKNDKGRWRFHLSHGNLPIHEDGLIVSTASQRGIMLYLAWRDDGAEVFTKSRRGLQREVDASAWFTLDDARALRAALDREIVLAEENLDENPPTDETRALGSHLSAKLLKNMAAINELFARGETPETINALVAKHGTQLGDVIDPSPEAIATAAGRSTRKKVSRKKTGGK